MALLFATNSADRVDCGSGASLNNLSAFTAFAWVYVIGTMNAFNGRVVNKGDVGSATKGKEPISITTGDKWFIEIDRAGVNAAATGFSAITFGKWIFIATTYDETDGPRIFDGDLSTEASEKQYSSRTVGDGATDADSSSELWLGNRSIGTANRAPNARIACAGYIAERLTITQIRKFQWNILACLDFDVRGLWILHGVDTQPDMSGNLNNGTVTGPTTIDHVPLGPLVFDVASPYRIVTGVTATAGLVKIVA